jgi:hypothetical protein
MDVQAQNTNPDLTTQSDEVRPEALINDDMSIVLDVLRPVVDSYTVDVNHFANNMSDQQSADVFMDQFEKTNVELLIDYNTMLATIKLTFDSSNINWTVLEWNEYLKSN